MAPKNTGKKDQNTDTNTLSDTIIDVDEVLEEGAPAEMARLVGIHLPRIREIKVQTNRPGLGWRYLKRKAAFASGPDATVDELCIRIIRMCLDDAHKNGPAQKYRARLGLHLDDETEKLEYRYVPVKIATDSEGELVVVDDTGGMPGSDNDPLMRRVEQVFDLNIRSLEEVTKATESFGRISEGIAKIMETHTNIISQAAESLTSDAELQVRLRELDHEDNMTWADMQTRMERIKQLGNFGDKIAGPVGEAIGEGIKLLTEIFGDQFIGGKGPMAEQWSTFLDSLSEDEMTAFKSIFNEDEWSIVQAAKEAEDDAAFTALFTKIAEGVGKRMTQEEFMTAMSKAVGSKIMKLLPIWKKMQEQGA